MTPDRRLLDSLLALRRQWRQRVILESLVVVLLAAVASVLAGWAIATVLAGDGAVVAMRVVAYVLLAGAVVRFLLLPLLRRTTDAAFALYVERHAPELRQGLVSAVHELQAPDAERGSPALASRLYARTADQLAPIAGRRAIERPRMIRATQAFAAVAVVGALVLAFGPAEVRVAARVIFAPWSTAQAAIPVRMVRVVPGDAAVPRGATVDVGATLVHFATDDAMLHVRTDSGEWTAIPMEQGRTEDGFTVRLFDLTRPTEYYVAAGGVRSPVHRLTVTDLPAVSTLALELRFPRYTGQAPELVADGGDIAALTGTTVILRPVVTRHVRGGSVVFDDGATVPLVLDSAGALVGAFRVRANGFYRIDLTTTEGAVVPGNVQYAIEAIPDRAPTVRIEEPGRDAKATSVEEVGVAVAASDDHGVASLELRWRVNGGEERRAALGGGGRAEPRAVHTLFLEELSLKPGDLIAYHAIARDAVGNTATSDIYFLEIRPFGRDYRRAEQSGGGGGGQGEGPQSPDGFVARQREVIAGTFNWLRDSASATARARRENAATLTIAEGRLREDVASLARRMVERGAAREDTSFAQIVAALNAAGRALQSAEELLVRSQARGALSPEQQALAELQRAEAIYRDVQVSMGQQQQQQGGGGGGGQQQQRPEDLADLFELENDKRQNQYEAVQQRASGGGEAGQRQQQEDEALARLKELARRQQQENDRAQRAAQAMQERLGQQSSSSSSSGAQASSQSSQSSQSSSAGSGGGSGASQRQLAQQAEQEARRLERLAREQRSPEMSQAAQELQQAADAMRRASTGNAAQAQAAQQRLQRAMNGLQQSQADRAGQQVRALGEQARQLEAQQREIAQGVRELGGSAGAQRAERLRALDQQKEALARGVEQLEQAAEQAAREARREQPRAAAAATEGANALRDQRVRDKIGFSRNVMRGSSPDYANALEEQIGENLAEASERMRAAASALGAGPAGRERSNSLDDARELVRGVESLADRARDAAERRNGGRGNAETAETADRNGAQGQQNARGQQGQQPGQQQGQRGQRGQQGQQGQQTGQQQGRGQNPQGQNPGQAQGRGQSPQGQSQQGGRGTGEPRQGEPGGAPDDVGGGDARQFSRELGRRRAAAEGLRERLRGQGVDARDLRELDQAIAGMRELERRNTFGDPRGVERLQASVVEGLKAFEFGLARRMGATNADGPALGADAAVPEAYRKAVEEYYRSLAASRKP